MPNLHLRYGDGNNNGTENSTARARCQWLTVGGQGARARLDGPYCQQLTPRTQAHFNTRVHVHIHSGTM